MDRGKIRPLSTQLLLHAGFEGKRKRKAHVGRNLKSKEKKYLVKVMW